MRSLALLLLASLSSVAGTVTFSGTVPLTDAGLGAAATMLRSSGAGCVGWNGTADVIGGSVCEGWSGILGPTSLNKTRTYSLEELATTLADLQIVFNPAEAGSSTSITLEQFIVMVFNPAGGAPVLTAALPAAFPIDDAGTGTGTAGFLFSLSLSPAELALADHPTYRIGLAFTTTGEDGAAESFFRFDPASVPGDVSDVPEPNTAALMFGALAAAGMFRYSRRRRRTPVE